MTTPGAAMLANLAATRFEDLPKPAVEMARLAVLDWWGVTVAGADEPVARLLRDVLGEAGGSATVLGTARTASPLGAAFLNGTAAHALDYDDVSLALPGHLTAPLLPGLVALAEARERSGRELLVAFATGVDATCRIARALAPGHYRAGWHATATIGRLGGTVAAGRLLGFDAARLDVALGLAASQLGGIQEAFGTMAKPFQVGRAAADALLAALAAEAGLSGPVGLLDRAEWARRLSPSWTPEPLARDPGSHAGLVEIVFKRFPCCFATHATIAACLALRPRPDPRRIDAIELEVCPTTLQVADQRAPATGLAGKFSVTYCAAVALLRGRVVEADFTDDAVRDPAAAALAARVTLRPNPGLDETRAAVTLRLGDGGAHEARADLRAELDPDRLAADLEAKFQALVAPRLGPREAERLAEAFEALDQLPSVRRLTRDAWRPRPST